MSFAAVPPAPAWQDPAVVHVAVPTALTLAPPTAVVLAVARVAQPALVPLSQVAAAKALVVPNRLATFVPAAGRVALVPATTCAVQAVLPVHAVAPFATDRLCWPFSPALTAAFAVNVAVQPFS